MTEKNKQTKSETEDLKMVGNRSGHRVELVINEEVVVFLPGKITNVPKSFEIPDGLGLYCR